MPRLSWPEACARRLEWHALSVPLAGATPDRAAAVMCGAHAQVMTAAEWSIGLRLTGLTRSDVRAAVVSERSLVKTFGPRGTVHLLPARDLPMWTGALSALPVTQAARQSAWLTPAQADQVVEAIADALLDADLTIGELTEAVVSRAGPWAGEEVIPAFAGMWPRWRQALSLAGNRGAACFGPPRGRHVTFASPGRLLPGFAPVPAPAALAWLVRSYLTAYGPATPAQFAQWLAVPRRWAAELFDSLAGDLRQVELSGTAAWLPAAGPARPAAAPRGVRLLPYFDSYVIGCQPRELLFPGIAAGRALSRSGQAGNFPVLLIDGTAGGVWHQRRAGAAIDITVEPFGELTAGQRRDLDGQAERLGTFMEAVPRLRIGAVTAGRHL